MKNIILFVFKKESRYAFEHAWKTGKLQEETQENVVSGKPERIKWAGT